MAFPRVKLAIFLCVLSATTLSVFPSVASCQNQNASVAANPENVRKRVEELLKKMTLEEKIGKLNQVSAANFLNPPNREEMIRKGQIGSFLWSVDSAQLDKYQHIAMEESRLRIPLLFGYDVIHGYRTVFPVPLAMAASWDPQVPEKAQA